MAIVVKQKIKKSARPQTVDTQGLQGAL